MKALRLVCSQLACRRGARLLFEGLDLSLSPGAALVVTGPNGTGKSSLLRILAGLARPEAGSVRLEGAAESEHYGTETHYLGHLDSHKGALTARENLAFWCDMLAVRAAGAGDIEDALAAVGLDGLGSLPAAVLSAGQKRRLALARLLVAPRPLWLLDEPTTALDTSAQATFAALARAHVEEGGLLIVATHAPLDIGPFASLDLATYRPARPVAA